MTVLFPQKRTFKGLAWTGDRAPTWVLQVQPPYWVDTSEDTTDGLNGTWTRQLTETSSEQIGFDSDGQFQDRYRTRIRAFDVANVRGIRLSGISPGPDATEEFKFRRLHVYANIPETAGERLMFWHPTLDQSLRAPDMDCGDLQLSQSVTKTFRVKNMSATQTATSIAITREVATNSGGGTLFTEGFKISSDDATYGDTLNIGNLAPGAVSSVLYVRYSTTLLHPYGPHDPYLVAIPTDWT